MKKLTSALLFAKLKIEGFKKGEVGAVDIVAIVILMGVAVMVALVFKGKVSQLINDFFDEDLSSHMKDVFKPE